MMEERENKANAWNLDNNARIPKFHHVFKFYFVRKGSDVKIENSHEKFYVLDMLLKKEREKMIQVTKKREKQVI